MNHASKINPDRRRAIALMGGGVVLASTALVGCSSSYPTATLQAWQPPQGNTDVRRWMLAHGLLAPNPHNRQPWIADLQREGEITLVCDANRLLPETDPFGRQILIGCGGFIELAVLAAAERGYSVSVVPFPAGEPGPSELPGGRAVARLVLVRDATVPRDPLFAQIVRRHTNKSVYDAGKPVPATALQRFGAAAREMGLLSGDVVDAPTVENVRKITRASFEIEMTTSRTWLESARLLRIGPDEIEKHRDGISVMGTLPRLMVGLGMLDRFDLPVPGNGMYKQVMARFALQETGSGYFWIASRGNSRRSQLQAGRAYVRAHLHATASGIDMHPLSQALQEFKEVRPQYEALHGLLGFDAAQTTLQMLARIGYAKVAAGPTPRRALDGLLKV